MRPRRAWLVFVTLIAGCYASHERPDARVDAAGVADAGVDAAEVGSDAARADAWRPDRPARLIAPMSTSRVTSLRPTLRWEPGSGSGEDRVDLCRDRACTSLIETLVGTGIARPSEALSPGWVFWRVTSGAFVSATWQLEVPVRGADVDTAWGTALDLDGDGYLEEVRSVVTGGDTNVGVFYGTPSGLEPVPRVVIASTECNAGALARSAGDVDGDGFADLLLTESPEWCRPGRARVFLGGPMGVSTEAHVRLDDFVPARPGYGRFALGVGDLDEDGYGDLAIGVRDRYGNFGPLTAEVFRGSEQGITSGRGLTVTVDELSLRAERPPLAAADVNGDGRADLIVGPAVYLGTAGGVDRPSFVFERKVKAVAVGDVNGDGYADWAVASDVVDPTVETARVSVFHGGPTGIGGEPATVIVGPDQYFGREVTLSDVNGDGIDDLEIVVPPGGSVTYFGSPAGIVAD